MRLLKPTISILAIYSTVSTALGAVDLNVSLSSGVQSLQGTPIYDPLHQYILYGLGLVALLGVAALIKCGGANFFGHVIGSPQTSAAGWKGALSVIIFLVFFVTMIGWYEWAM
jgi:hypothetical protein